MINQLFSVYDSKACCYSPVLQFRTVDEALRAIEQPLFDINHPICNNPEDFTLFNIGEFNDIDAEIKPQKSSVINCLELKSIVLAKRNKKEENIE